MCERRLEKGGGVSLRRNETPVVTGRIEETRFLKVERKTIPTTKSGWDGDYWHIAGLHAPRLSNTREPWGMMAVWSTRRSSMSHRATTNVLHRAPTLGPPKTQTKQHPPARGGGGLMKVSTV